MRTVHKAALTGIVMGTVLVSGVSTASASPVAAQKLDTTVSTAGLIKPMHYTDCGWTGCTVYFNKHETSVIAGGGKACVKMIPSVIAKGECAAIGLTAAYAKTRNECVAVKVGIGAAIWPERNHHCY